MSRTKNIKIKFENASYASRQFSKIQTMRIARTHTAECKLYESTDLDCRSFREYVAEMNQYRYHVPLEYQVFPNAKYEFGYQRSMNISGKSSLREATNGFREFIRELIILEISSITKNIERYIDGKDNVLHITPITFSYRKGSIISNIFVLDKLSNTPTKVIRFKSRVMNLDYSVPIFVNSNPIEFRKQLSEKCIEAVNLLLNMYIPEIDKNPVYKMPKSILNITDSDIIEFLEDNDEDGVE